MASAVEPEFGGTERFRVLRRLGSGGMGVVYEALDREKNARVALKTLRTPTADMLLHLKEEFHALADLGHPNLVSLSELICEGGHWFFTMELLEGTTFLQHVRMQAVEEDSDHTPDTHVLTPTPSRPSSTGSYRVVPSPGAVGPPADPERLRGALGQLARGLVALHAAGKVHRDIKPSNILVTTDERVVLLDFGLVTDTSRGADTTDLQVVGTADYMAPEQAASRPVGPPADWYSVGVLLYQALTGRLPFAGTPLEILFEKQRGVPPAPLSVRPEVPPDLDALCMGLLAVEPERRPTGHEVVALLEGSPAAPRRATEAPPSRPTFVGRHAERAELEAALDRSALGNAVTVFIEGESGVGKSALVKRFVEALPERSRGAVVLAGRCYERESVPYKAIDGVVDALSRYLRRLPPEEAARSVPLNAPLLTQVFPVLARVPALIDGPRRGREGERPDAQELRTRTFAALRELFTRLGGQHTLILVIDDLQWADPDSLALLAALLAPPDPPPLLLVATLRSGGAQLDLPGEVRRIALDRLAAAEARELAALLLGSAGAGADAIAAEAGGHPLFIDELVRHGAAGAGTLKLDDALWTRAQKLDPETRRVLEVTAVAGTPLRQDTCAEACELTFARLAEAVHRLRAQNLVRTTGVRRTDAVEPYHDRVREATLSRLTEDARRALHRRIAIALEATDSPDSEALTTHWLGAGDAGQAGFYAQVAAQRAADALAFDRAAQLYGVALELHTAPAGRLDLLVQRARALASAGRGEEAARVFQSAAELAEPQQAAELGARAAQQLLISGHIDAGLDAARSVLSQIGLRMPGPGVPTLLALGGRRMQLALRGLRFRERAAEDLPPDTLFRLDVAWSVATALAMADAMRGGYFATRHLLWALAAGEPARICSSLALEASFSATPGVEHRKRTAALVARTGELASRLGLPYPTGAASLGRAVAAYLEGRFRNTLQAATDAERMLRDCTDVAWEVDSSVLFGLWSRYYLGELAELTRLVPLRLREASERGDLYVATFLQVGLFNAVHLFRDDPAGARHAAEQAIARWSHQGFHIQHHHAFVAHAQIDLYEGNADVVLAAARAHWPNLRRSLLAQIQIIRIEAIHLRGRAALACAARRSLAERRPLLEEALAAGKRLGREAGGWAGALGALLEAGVRALAGDRGGALARLGVAQQLAEEHDLGLYACVARRCRGQLLAGPEGVALVEESDAWLRAQHVVAPARLAAMLAPGLDDPG